MGEATVLGTAVADVAASREALRQRRLGRLALVAAVFGAWLWWRYLTNNPIELWRPSLQGANMQMVSMLIIVGLLGCVILLPLLAAGRSPHVLYRASEIDVSLDDVKGAGMVRDEVIKTLNLFLAYRTFKEQMGGTPRRAILFEGPPGTGKTYMAKAMAREAGVPFLFVSSSAFQSMYYGQTNRKIRNYFKSVRKAARQEGGAVGFIEEIDAIGASRQGMRSGNSEGISGVVNELLIQLQSFDEPTRLGMLKGWFIDRINRLLPPERQLRKKAPTAANILIVGATNRAADLDPALVRPGRFDRTVHFGLPGRSDRREIIDYYLAKKAHDPDLDRPERRDQLAAMTFGYSPVMIEHLFDEALVWALRRGAPALDWADVQQAKMTEELGLTERVEYTDEERRTIATHEAGHATVAWLVGTDRKLDVLSIVKRRDALGLLAHSDLEERFTKRKGELFGLVQIAFGGMVAEELYFGEAGTGPSGDLVGATSIAAQMVGSFGMAGSLISYEASALAGHDNLVAKVLASEAGRDAVEALLADAKASVHEMLRSHSHILEGLRDALLERDELIGDEITDVIGEVARGAVRPGPMTVAASRVVDLRDGADDVQQEGQHEGLLPPRVVPS